MTNIASPAGVSPAPRLAAAAGAGPSGVGPSGAGPSGAGPSGVAARTGAAPAGGTHASGGVSRPPQPPDLTKIAKSAQDFESMAINELLKPMFDTVDTAHGAFGGGDGEEAWKPMMVQQIAKQIAASGGLGLAKPVYDAMLRMQEMKSK